jgi:hypothetical protein
MEEGTTDWNSRTKQRERPKRDRLIASPVRAKLSSARVFETNAVIFFYIYRKNAVIKLNNRRICFYLR